MSSGTTALRDGEVLARFDDVSVTFPDTAGRPLPVLSGLDLEIRQGSFTAIVGPSGCGKTTILNLLADAIEPTSGTVTIGGEPPGSGAARAGYLLARDALLPWRSAHKNVELPLELLGTPAGERRRIAAALLERVGLAGYGDHAVKALSHGMRQRVSLARILAYDPDIMLLDEPFSALDAQTRMKAQEFFLEVWARDRKTVVLVTHDIQEALFMADEVLTFSPRPTRLLRRFTVDFPRPREIEDLRRTPAFNEMYDEIWRLLKSDVEY
ncbi:ABC transporter ATP-binding protein [Pseudonocardia ailaonensis]|uniref:ABC transporter ATP-binding protein n=1 Tax=Pseudonocardia ailaonensis TaxID=367279 RepID=A0ABN2NP95_9PSEU